MKSIRVVVADDHPLFRRGLVDAIQRTDGIDVVGEAERGDDAWRLIEKLRPEVAVVDVEMPGDGALAIARKAREAKSDVRLVVLTMHRDEAIFNESIDAGALGYVVKDAAASEITAAIRSVAAGRPYISASVSPLLLARANRTAALAADKPELERLTPAERRILKSISLGLTSKEVAQQLGVSFRTVENHRANICTKLQISGPNALLRFALEHKSEL